MSPASHFFLFEKGEKNNKWNLFTVAVKKHFGKLSVPLLVPDAFSRTRTVVKERFFFKIACDCLQSHAIAWQSGVESRTTRRIEFDLLPLSPPTNASSRPSCCLPLYRQTSIATSRRIINCIAIPSVIASSYHQFHVVTRRHTLSHHTVTSLYHRCCHAT